MAFNTIRFDRLEAVAQITLNRPAAANGMNLELLKELADAALQCDEDPSIRAVIVTGEGRFFSAGGDLAAFGDDLDRLPSLLKELTLHLHAAISRFMRMSAPVIAAVNGPAAGAGMSLAAACDIVIASDTASFTMAYTGAGLSPDGGSTWTIPRRIGHGRTRELVLTNRKLSATEALDWGFANEVVSADMLGARARARAETLSMGPTSAYGRAKSLLADSFHNGLETQLELEARAIADSARGDDAREGITAFLGKRRPQFRGA